MAEAKEGLDYHIVRKAAFAVVSFQGSLTKRNVAVLEKCRAELASYAGGYVVLSFGGVTEMDIPGVAALVQLQKAARDQNHHLRLCLLKPKFRVLMDERGALRRHEVAADLQDAISSCMG